MTRATGHAYPWDVLGDPSFAARVTDLGLTEVTLAASYHSARASTPLHPEHQIVEARHAALYRPVRPVWMGRVLKPLAPEWMMEDDPFRTAAIILREAGIAVNAWVVLNHNSALGQEHPQLAAVNCFGDRYPYALCPQQSEVRTYASLLAQEAVREAPVTGVTLEAWGQLGVTHNSLHEKTAGAWGPLATRLLSVCCCTACRADWGCRGADADSVVTVLRSAVRSLQMDDVPRRIDESVLDLVLLSRHAAAGRSLEGVIRAIDEVTNALEVRIFSGSDPWGGASYGALTDAVLGRISTVINGAWTPGLASVEAVQQLRALMPATIDLSAYVTVVPPMTRDGLVDHVLELTAAGASALNLYHLGLASRERLGWMKSLTSH